MYGISLQALLGSRDWCTAGKGWAGALTTVCSEQGTGGRATQVLAAAKEEARQQGYNSQDF